MTHKYSTSSSYFSGNPHNKTETFLIVGYERSGTSMLAGTLHKLGIFMGDEFLPPVYEDERLGNALKSGKNYSSIIGEYNQRFDQWGFKKPSANLQLIKRLKYFRYPAIIFIARDTVAVTNRTSQVGEKEFLSQFDKNMTAQRKLLKRVTSANVPTLYCSYEKILQKPDAFLGDLIKAFNLDVTPESLETARNFITPEPVEYLQACSPIRNVSGYIDRIYNGKEIHGWAYHRKLDQNVRLDIIVNDVLIDSIECELYREDLEQVGRGGKCAFKFSLPVQLEKNVDKLDIIPFGETYSLPESSNEVWNAANSQE